MKLFSPILRAQIIKEILCVLRDPKARIGIIVPPILQLLIFSFAVTLDVKNVNLAIFDMDNSAYSQELVSALNEAQFVGKMVIVHNQSEIEERIEDGKSLVGVTIPQDFSKNLTNKEPAQIQVIIDGRRANSGQLVASYIDMAASNLGAYTQTKIDKLKDRVGVRYWFNPTLNYFWFVTPSLVPIMVTISAMGISSMSISREREMGTFDQLLVSPANYIEIVIAKLAPSMIIGPFLGLVMTLAAMFVFGVPFTGSFITLIIALFLHSFAVASIGLIISSFADTQQQAILGMFSLAAPMILMSGFATPIENMPQFLQFLANGIPNKHILIIVQDLFLKQQGFAGVEDKLIALLIIGAISSLSAMLIVRSKLR